jgi:hypothetical protein
LPTNDIVGIPVTTPVPTDGVLANTFTDDVSNNASENFDASASNDGTGPVASNCTVCRSTDASIKNVCHRYPATPSPGHDSESFNDTSKSVLADEPDDGDRDTVPFTTAAGDATPEPTGADGSGGAGQPLIATPDGPEPTAIVDVTVFVEPSMTETVPLP